MHRGPRAQAGHRIQRRDVRARLEAAFEQPGRAGDRRQEFRAAVAIGDVLPADEYRRLLTDRGATDPVKGMALMARTVIDTQRRCLPLLERELEPGRTLVVGSSLAWAARLLGETSRAPVVTVRLAPSWFRSDHLAPSIGPLGHLQYAPAFVKRVIWRLMDRRLLDPLFTAPLNALRTERGLPPLTRTFHRWIHEADLTLGMFPDWFAPRQPDWPSNLQLVGFPLDDDVRNAQLSPDVERFLDAGEPPVAFTAGTANASSHAFFEASVNACRISGRRGLMLTQDATQLPAKLPPHVAHFVYVPFEALLPRLSALVHHGGIGTTHQALRAGALDALVADRSIRMRCAELGRTLSTEPSGTIVAADALLELGRRAGP